MNSYDGTNSFKEYFKVGGFMIDAKRRGLAAATALALGFGIVAYTVPAAGEGHHTRFERQARAAGYSWRFIHKVERAHAERFIVVRTTQTHHTHQVAATTADRRKYTGHLAFRYLPSNENGPLTCYTPDVVATGYNNSGDKIYTFTMYVHYCWQKVWPGPPALIAWDVQSYWSATNVNEHIVHKVYSWAATAGWSYKGLDSTGNWGPTRHAWDPGCTGCVSPNPKGMIDTSRQGHFHLHFGLGPAAVNDDAYPRVEAWLHGNGSGTEAVYHP